MNNQSQEIVKAISLFLITVSILSSVYYINLSSGSEKNIEENNYLKSEICYYALNGIKSDYHYHLQLNITINGDRIEIPANIGFETDESGETKFIHPIHTYDNSGRVHVETTKNTTAELGFFFDIWGKDFSKESILNYNVNNEYLIEMKVNNNIVNTFEKTVLEPYLYIDIEYKSKN